MVPSRVKDTTSTANTDSMEPSFGKSKTGVSGPLEQGITIREPLPQTHSRMQVDAEAYGENKNSDYKRKGKRNFSLDDSTRDSAHSTLKRAISEAAEPRFREEEWLQQQRDRAIGIGDSSDNFRRPLYFLGNEPP